MMLPATIDTPFGPSVEGAGAPLLAEVLVELEMELGRISFPVDRLRPGLPRAEIAARFAAVERPVPDELLTWFEWHDGATVPPGAALLQIAPARVLLGLDAMLRFVREPPMPYGYEVGNWQPEWTMLAPDMGCGILVNHMSDPGVAPLVRTMWEYTFDPQEGPTQQVVSLCTPVTWWIEAIRSGGWAWDIENHLWRTYQSALPMERSLRGFL